MRFLYPYERLIWQFQQGSFDAQDLTSLQCPEISTIAAPPDGHIRRAQMTCDRAKLKKRVPASDTFA